MKYKLAILTYRDGNVQLNELKTDLTSSNLRSRSLHGFRRNEKARHRRPTAHARARYRCFLPDLAGLAGVRRAGPMPDLLDFNIPDRTLPFRGGFANNKLSSDP